MDTINQIYDKHQTWIDITKTFDVNSETAKDIVSEMYIRVLKHTRDEGKSILYDNGEINYYFIFITLRNLVYDLKREEKKIHYVGVEGLQSRENEDYIEDPNIYDKHKTITEWFEHPEFLELLQAETFIKDFTKDKMQIYYLRRIFEEVFVEGKKIAKLSRDSKITYWSLRNTIKIIKKQIKKEYETRHTLRENI